MPKLEYFIACESISVDVDRNTISLFHALNQISPEEFPYRIPQLVVVSTWISDSNDIKNRVESQLKLAFFLPNPDDNRDFRGNLTSESRVQQVAFSISDIPISEPGKLVITLSKDDEHQATHTIFILGPDDDD